MTYTPYGVLLYQLSYPARAGAGLEPATRDVTDRSNTHLRHLLISLYCKERQAKRDGGPLLRTRTSIICCHTMPSPLNGSEVARFYGILIFYG